MSVTRKIAVIHPIFLSLYFVVFFYSQNTWLFFWPDPFIAAGIIISATLFLFYIFARLLRDYKKGGLLISLSLLIFFSYGHIINSLKSLAGGAVRIRYVMLGLGLIYVFSAYVISRTRRDLARITKVLNLVAIFLVLIPSFQIGVQAYQTSVIGKKFNKDSSIQDNNPITQPLSNLPDIYYIILDAYAHQETLKDSFGYSNDEFYSFLQEKGFYIASESNSNYGYTMLSLPSSLNMRYLDDLVEKYGSLAATLSGNTATLRYMMEDNEIQRFLKSRGYKFIYVSSGSFAPTSVNRSADVNFSWDLTRSLFVRNDFIVSLLRETFLLGPLYLDKRVGSTYSGDGEGVLYAFDRLREMPALPSANPVFVFAHILSPHPEFTLDRECNIIPQSQIPVTEGTASIKPYLEKLICTNKRLEEFIDQALATSKTPPIIILQSDHGFGSGKTSLPPKIETREDIPPEIAREYLRNFNAYYLPDGGNEILYPSITPVNSFRLVFNYYFNTSFELLEDKSYFLPNEQRIYQLFDVTDYVTF